MTVVSVSLEADSTLTAPPRPPHGKVAGIARFRFRFRFASISASVWVAMQAGMGKQPRFLSSVSSLSSE